MHEYAHKWGQFHTPYSESTNTYALFSLEFEEFFLYLALPGALDGEEIVQTRARDKFLVLNVLQSPQDLRERWPLGVFLSPAYCVCMRASMCVCMGVCVLIINYMYGNTLKGKTMCRYCVKTTIYLYIHCTCSRWYHI